MAGTVNDYVSRMRLALAVSEPELDTTVGTVTRKLLDAVGEVIAEAGVDRHLLTYQYDINAKTGADLDEFVRLFGFSRFPAKRATGMVTFERTSVATADILIPMGTQVTTEGVTPVVAQTTAPALLVIGSTVVDVPVQAVIGGTVGNVPAHSLRYRVSPLTGISSFTNLSPLTGGADAESDAQLRTRWSTTVFRNMAGTEQMFLATALNDPAVTKAVVLGAARTWRERIEVVAGTVTSTLAGARFIYPDSQTFGADLDAGNILTPGVHYDFDDAENPPVVTVLDAGAAPDGVYDLEYEYVPGPSRNDPTNGITNRIDIYVNGSRATAAVESLTFATAKVFNTTGGSVLNRLNFERLDATNPVAGNYFVRFSMSPVMDPASTNLIVIDGVTYTENTDFWMVNDVTTEGGTASSYSGIEFKSAANGQSLAIPDDGQAFDVTYVFNAVPGDVERAVREWRLITTDVKVHEARPLYLDLHMAVVYQPGFTEGAIRPLLEAALAAYMADLGFSGLVQVSDLLEVAQRIPGIDAVRFLTDSDDDTHYAIQRVSGTGTILATYATNVGGQIRRALDVQIGDHEYPVFNSLVLVSKANNTFGAV